MNMFDEARSLKCMLESRKMTQKELARSLGVSASYVANKLRLLHHTEDMQRKIIDCRVSERHARALLRIAEHAEREEALSRIIAEGMSVERAEAMISIMTDERAPAAIAESDKDHGLIRFLDNLTSSCNALSSIGINVNKSVRYIEKKLCIFISVDE